jgi:hypothetical protein
MTPKEKAKELVNKFYVILMKKNYPNVAQMDAARECALIAVDEMLVFPLRESAYRFYEGVEKPISIKEYLELVKQEIEKL